MKKRSKQTLLLAELIGGFMILMGVLTLVTNNILFSKIFFILFLMTIISTVSFIFFLVMAIKEHKLR